MFHQFSPHQQLSLEAAARKFLILSEEVSRLTKKLGVLKTESLAVTERLERANAEVVNLKEQLKTETAKISNVSGAKSATITAISDNFQPKPEIAKVKSDNKAAEFTLDTVLEKEMKIISIAKDHVIVQVAGEQDFLTPLCERRKIFSIKDIDLTRPPYKLTQTDAGDSEMPKNRVLFAFDIDDTILRGKIISSKLVEPEMPEFIKQLSTNSQIHTMGLTARKTYSMFANTFDPPEDIDDGHNEQDFRSLSCSGVSVKGARQGSLDTQDYIQRDLERLGIKFEACLPFDFRPEDCRYSPSVKAQRAKPNFNVLSWQFSDVGLKPDFKHGILFSDHNANKGDVLYGFLPSVIHDIDEFHMIDDDINSINSVINAITDLNEKHGTSIKVVGYHYARVACLKKMGTLEMDEQEQEDVLSWRKRLNP